MSKYREGHDLLERGAVVAAQEMFRSGMEEGDPKCVYGAMVAVIKAGGDYLNEEKLLHAVIPLLEQQARQADAEACFILGRCNEVGAAIPQNIPAAFALYTQAASLGHVDAMFNLGCMYMAQGAHEMAADYYRRAAEKGSVDAKDALAHYNTTRKKEEG